MKKVVLKGYILFESLVALMLIFILVSGYLHLSVFLLETSHKRQEHLAFCRRLYNETQRKVRHNEVEDSYFQTLEFVEEDGIQKIIAEKDGEKIVVERY